MLDIKFHGDEVGLFSKGFPARAFPYYNYSIPLHTHDFYEINIILSGTGIHCMDHGKVRAAAGDVFIIPPLVAHAYEDTENLTVYHILLKKAFLSENKEESMGVDGYVQLVEIEPLLRSSFSQACFLHLNHRQLNLLKEELEFIDDNGTFSWEECHAMKYHTIWKILYWFSHLLNKQLDTMTGNAENTYAVQVIQTLEYIHTHYNEKITIEKLCGDVFLSRSTFLRSFKAVCGMPPMEYVNAYRCKMALGLLDKNELSKTEIAYCCGFYDLSHMERMLKKYA